MLLGWGILAVPTGIVTAEMAAERFGRRPPDRGRPAVRELRLRRASRRREVLPGLRGPAGAAQRTAAATSALKAVTVAFMAATRAAAAGAGRPGLVARHPARPRHGAGAVQHAPLHLEHRDGRPHPRRSCRTRPVTRAPGLDDVLGRKLQHLVGAQQPAHVGGDHGLEVRVQRLGPALVVGHRHAVRPRPGSRSGAGRGSPPAGTARRSPRGAAPCSAAAAGSAQRRETEVARRRRGRARRGQERQRDGRAAGNSGFASGQCLHAPFSPSGLRLATEQRLRLALEGIHEHPDRPGRALELAQRVGQLGRRLGVALELAPRERQHRLAFLQRRPRAAP